MRRALVIGASGGIGQAVATELNQRWIAVETLSRSSDSFEITDENSVRDHLGRLEGNFDLIFVATGALVVDGHEPEKALREVTPDGLLGQFRVNALGPMLVLKHALHLLPRDRRAVFAALSARVGSIGDNKIGGWHSYRTSKAALNQLIHGASIELSRTHKQSIAVCLHPGTVRTAFTRDYAGRHATVAPEEAARNLVDVIAGLGPEDTGGFFDYAGRHIPW